MPNKKKKSASLHKPKQHKAIGDFDQIINEAMKKIDAELGIDGKHFQQFKGKAKIYSKN